MPNQIRPNRQEVSDRFPMLGFTIRTDGDDKRYEVVIASDASLFRADARPKRTRANFYSSRAAGLQPIDRGEAVYVLPPEVLARFVGQEKLYYALATYDNGKPEISALPSDGSPYISLKSLSGRSLKRVRVLPSRQRAAASYGNGAGNELEWAGDAAMPGTQPVAAIAPSPAKTNGNGAGAAPAVAPPPSPANSQAAALEYNDGWGPMPAPYTPPYPEATSPRPAARAQANASYSINWDDVELIPQPTDMTCWAAAAAMVLGWRDQVSLTPERIAEIAGRSTVTGIYPSEHCKFAGEVGLECDSPKSYSIDGFASLLKASGPLWVGVMIGKSGHAVVVTGMYSDGAEDGSDTFVRIADPWDRVVGKPGAPGGYLKTHNTGSRYILSWADFMSEYEGRASSAADGTVNVQILYATRKTDDQRQPSYSGAKGYAMAAAAPARQLEDDIPLDPGVGGMSIGPDSLEIGDIILSTTGAIISRAIRTASNAQVSHAMLYVGQGGQVVEAVGSGVRLIPLADAIKEATVAVAFRLPGLSSEQKQQIADAAGGYIDRDYDFMGIVRQAAFQMHSRVCRLVPESGQEACRQWVGRVDLGTGTNDQFFCSALIIAAYEAANARLTSTPPRWTSPGDLAEIALRRGLLAYVGHLKAPPAGSSRSVLDVFGLGLSAAQGMNGTRYGRARAMEDDVSSLSPDDDQGIEEGIPESLGLSSASSAQSYAGAMATSPEYPQASRFAPAASVNYRSVSGTRTINRVVIHITDGGKSINGPISWFQNPNQLDVKGKPIHVSAHYVVGQDGEVVQMVRHNDVAWHASSANGDSIGIEHVANTKGLKPTEAEYCASAALTRWLCDTYSIPIDRTHVLGHAEADPKTKHDCPSAVWDWDYYMDMVKTASCHPKAQGLALSNGYEQVKRPAPPAPIIQSRAMNAAAVEIASVVAGAVMERVSNHEGNITWDLEQLRGLKHPNDTAPSPVPAFHDAATIRLDSWPYVDALDGDRLSAWFTVDWQYNGKSLGNVQITNVGTNGALLQGMHITAKIMDDNIVYPADNPTYAALRVRFNYRFTRAIGSDWIAITELHLYGNGTFDKTSRWEQN